MNTATTDEITEHAYQSGYRTGTKDAILYKAIGETEQRIANLMNRIATDDDPEDIAYASGLAQAYRERLVELQS